YHRGRGAARLHCMLRFLADPRNLRVARSNIDKRVPIMNKESIAPGARGKFFGQKGERWQVVGFRRIATYANRLPVWTEGVVWVRGVDRAETQPGNYQGRFLISLTLWLWVLGPSNQERQIEFCPPCCKVQFK